MENFRYTVLWNKTYFDMVLKLCFDWYITQTGRNANPPVQARQRIDAPTNATFQITNTKLYVQVVTLSTEDDNKLLEQLKSGLKRTLKWNKYWLEMIKQIKTNNLNYLIDWTFNKVFRLSYYLKMKTIEKLFQSIIQQTLMEIFFWCASKKQKRNIGKKIIEMSKNNDYTTGNLLDHKFFLKQYKL